MENKKDYQDYHLISSLNEKRGFYEEREDENKNTKLDSLIKDEMVPYLFKLIKELELGFIEFRSLGGYSFLLESGGWFRKGYSHNEHFNESSKIFNVVTKEEGEDNRDILAYDIIGCIDAMEEAIKKLENTIKIYNNRKVYRRTLLTEKRK